MITDDQVILYLPDCHFSDFIFVTDVTFLNSLFFFCSHFCHSFFHLFFCSVVQIFGFLQVTLMTRFYVGGASVNLSLTPLTCMTTTSHTPPFHLQQIQHNSRLISFITERRRRRREKKSVAERRRRKERGGGGGKERRMRRRRKGGRRRTTSLSLFAQTAMETTQGYHGNSESSEPVSSNSYYNKTREI